MLCLSGKKILISTYGTLVVKNGYSALANQRLAKILNTVFGAIGNRNVPTSISELLTARNSSYNLRGDAILKLPKVNSTKYGIKSWRGCPTMEHYSK